MQTIQIKGMSCQHCVKSVTEALQQLDGLKNITVNLDSGEARFENTKHIEEKTIKDRIIQIGFEVI